MKGKERKNERIIVRKKEKCTNRKENRRKKKKAKIQKAFENTKTNVET